MSVASVAVPVGRMVNVVTMEPPYPAVYVSAAVGPENAVAEAGVRKTGRENEPEVMMSAVGDGPRYGSVTRAV